MGLQTQAISKSYGAMRALNDVDLCVRKGEFFTLLGPSGCGKTTLLRIIAGLEMPDHGTVKIDGNDCTMVRANRRPVNTVFQSYAMFPHLTVLENVCFGLISRKIPKQQAIEKAKQTLDLVKLTGFESRKPNQLSGGQRQRVALARALANEPKVLLLDEPMSALDAKLRVQVQVELRQIQQRLGMTFIMVTHDQEEALTVSDRMAVMNAGQIAQVGSVQEVFDRPRSYFVADFLQAENFIEAEKVGARTIETRFGKWELPEEIPWERGTVAVRPEEIQLATIGSAECDFQACVLTNIYQGCYQKLILDNGITIECEVYHRFQEGEVVGFRVPRDAVVLLHDEGAERMSGREETR